MPTPQPPSPKRQRLQLQRSGLNKRPERHNPNRHTKDIGNIVSIPDDMARPSALDAPVLVRFEGAGEGGRHEGFF